jgi:hypothetical protein
MKIDSILREILHTYACIAALQGLEINLNHFNPNFVGSFYTINAVLLPKEFAFEVLTSRSEEVWDLNT